MEGGNINKWFKKNMVSVNLGQKQLSGEFGKALRRYGIPGRRGQNTHIKIFFEGEVKMSEICFLKQSFLSVKV